MTRAVARAAAWLADPARDTTRTIDGVSVDQARVVELLRANKVPLLEIAGDAFEGSDAWREAVSEERRQRDELVMEFSEVARALAERGLTPVLFKSAGGFPYRSSNVDLLVRPGEMSPIADRLEEMGHLRFPHYREDHKLLLRRFRKGRSVICLHLHEAVSWGKILILPGADVVERSRAPRTGESGFQVAGAEDLLIVTLAHSLYETDQIRLSDLRAVRLCAADATLDWDRVIGRVGGRGWLTGFCSILSVVIALENELYGETLVPARVRDQVAAALAGSRWARVYVDRMTTALVAEPPLPYRLSKAWSKMHTAALLMGQPRRTRYERLLDLLSTSWNLIANRLGLRCRPPVLVSLTGLDGSGKSSAIRALREAMTLCEIPTRVVWSRGGFSVPAQAAKRAARSVLGSRLPGPAELDRKRRWLSGRLTGALFTTMVVTEQAVHYLLRVRMPRWLGRSILCDRFAYDTLADLEAKLGRGRALARGAGDLVLAVAPEPDLAILLRLDPGEAARRKPGDAPWELLVEQSAILDRVAARCGLRVIDAGRPDDEVIGDLVDLTLRRVFAIFSRGRA